MFKHIIFIFFMALCLLSCSSSGQDDPFIPEPQQVGISFGGNSGSWEDANSRAGEGETGLESLFTSFKVWGYKTKNIDGGASNNGSTNSSIQKVMDGYLVDWNTSSNDWEYIGKYNASLKLNQTIKYWDYSASNYQFLAYAPSNANITTTIPNQGTDSDNASTSAQSTFQIPYEYNSEATNRTTPYVSDLWFASSTANSSTANSNPKIGDQVKLTFAPVVAKVRFKFKYQEDQTVEIKHISFRDVRWEKDTDGNLQWASASASESKTPIAGTIQVIYPHSNISASTSPTIKLGNIEKVAPIEFTIPYEEETDKNHQTNILQKWYFVPPMYDAYTQGAYTITAQVGGYSTTAMVPSEYMQWKAGYQYTYIFKISETNNKIIFAEVEVEKWDKNTNYDNNGNGTNDW